MSRGTSDLKDDFFGAAITFNKFFNWYFEKYYMSGCGIQ